MMDIFFLFFHIILFFLIGFPFTKLLPRRLFKMRPLIASTVGYAAISVVVTILYKEGISPGTSFRWSVVIAAAIGGGFAYKYYKTSRKQDSSTDAPPWKTIITIFFVLLAGAGVLLAPKWVGGTQFSVYQGNKWDTFVYLNSAVTCAKDPYVDVKSVSADNLRPVVRQPLMLKAVGNITKRPSAFLLYSSMGALAPHHFHQLHYTFLIFFFIQAFLVIFFIIINLFKSVSPLTAGLVSLVFPVGFWGQYVLDINSWSQDAFLPVMLLTLFIIVHIAGTFYHRSFKEIGKTVAMRLILFLAVLFAAGLYLYPESLLFHIPVIFSLLGIYALLCLWKKKRWAVVWVILAGFLLGMAAGIFYYEGTIGFGLRQAKWNQSESVEWWRYFQAYLMGKDSGNHSLWANGIDFLSGVLGLYFITPAKVMPAPLGGLLRGMLLLFISGCAYLFVSLMISVKKTFNNNEQSRTILFFFIIIVMSLFPILYLVLTKNYWGAGKALSWISPYFTVFLLLPLFLVERKRIAGVALVLLSAYVVLQLSFGMLRILGAKDPNGIQYPAPYPNGAITKTNVNFAVDGLTPHLEGVGRVKMDVKNGWLENYLMVYLYARDKRIYTPNRIDSNFGTGWIVGHQKPRAYEEITITEKVTRTIRVCKIMNIQCLEKEPHTRVSSQLNLVKRRFSVKFGPVWQTTKKKCFRVNSRQAGLFILNRDQKPHSFDLHLNIRAHNPDNRLSLYLNGALANQCETNGALVIKNILLTPGENRLEFQSLLPPSHPGDPAAENYFFHLISLRETEYPHH
ncbi:MAG: YfhO family protein [bacterium]|nr:YfhO family protein [bacterium]